MEKNEDLKDDVKKLEETCSHMEKSRIALESKLQEAEASGHMQSLCMSRIGYKLIYNLNFFTLMQAKVVMAKTQQQADYQKISSLQVEILCAQHFSCCNHITGISFHR